MRLIFEDPPYAQAASVPNERIHNMLRSILVAPQHVVVLVGEEGFEPSIS
jgi:hypothetical protein